MSDAIVDATPFEEIKEESFDVREKRILAFWAQKQIFKKSIEQKNGCPPFITYDGPPFATGLPHYGHLLAGTIKDVVLRYKTQQGYYVPRRFGWDCHGLPVENEIERAEGLSGSASIEAYGIPRFNEACRSIVNRYTAEWQESVLRMGRWVSFDDCYRTMDKSFMESVWWVFKKLFEKGLVYEGFRVMPYSAKLGTTLSNFEAAENYKEVDDPSLVVALTAEEEPNESFLIWTTTPWTLISNLAIMVGSALVYVKVLDKETERFYWIAEARKKEYFKDEERYQVVSHAEGSKLVGRRYQPLFAHFANRANQGAFRIIAEESVSIDEGTGLVHCAPAFGEVDFYACQRESIDLVCPVDDNGCFTQQVPEYQGLFVKEADKAIAKAIKEKNQLFYQGTCRHRYPFCWRSDTPLIYKAVSTWFIAVEAIKDKMVANANLIYWVPSHLKQGRFGKWLAAARDWNISRNRYWGTPIPLWRSEDGQLLAIGSLEELEQLSGRKVEDLHRHFIDDIIIEKGGTIYKRIPEVFDCWFESGSMPYAQHHYPFEQEPFASSFPADFIAEGLDQTRGWFYTLTILATALFDQPAFKNVIVNGIVLAKDGAKMSKRLRNYPDPMEVVARHGADAVRLYMMHSPASRAESLSFSEEGVALTLRQVLIPWWNAYSFFVTYARICQWQPKTGDDAPPLPEAQIDRWILARLNDLIEQMRLNMDDYLLSDAVEPLVSFVDALTNWYIRRSRRRFWQSDASQSRNEAFSTLYYVLIQLAKLAAPFVPFIAEATYLNLRNGKMAESVHLTHYPEPHRHFEDLGLLRGMEALRELVSMGHSLRKEVKIKVRQPLPQIEAAIDDPLLFTFIEQQKELIAEELNVKKINLHTRPQEMVQLVIKPNFRLLGKKVGKQMKEAQKLIEALNQQQIELLMNGSSLSLDLPEGAFELTAEDVQVHKSVKEGFVAAASAHIALLLDTTLDEPLLREGIAREIVNKVNAMRRDGKLDVTDRIALWVECDDYVKESFEEHKEYVMQEILALEVHFEKITKDNSQEWDLNGRPSRFYLSRVS